MFISSWMPVMLFAALVRCQSGGQTLSNLGLDIDPYNDTTNECLNGSVDGCGTMNQNANHPTYKLDDLEPTSISDSPIRRDILSELDYSTAKVRNSSAWQANDQETTLRQVLMIHRHGDRTPINFPPNDPLASEPFWQFHGLGQLTNRGKARLYILGKIIRDRYNKFLEGSVNKNMRKTRASGSLRCIESAQVFLSSFLSLDLKNSPDAQELVWDKRGNLISHMWQPTSVNTMAAKYDGMLNEGSQCNRLNDVYNEMDSSLANKKLSEEYKDVAEVMQKELGFEMDHYYKWFWGSSVVEVERSYFPDKMKPELMRIYDRLQEAGDKSLTIHQSTTESRRLRAGLLINDMIENMKQMRQWLSPPSNGTSPLSAQLDPTFVRKFVHYSAHDLNLVVLLGMLHNWDKYPTRPDYASTLLLELHQSQDNQWFVKFFYMPRVPVRPVELHLKACENDNGLCLLDNFNSLMQQYKIPNWQTWMRECKNDLTQVDPYSQNS